MSVFARSADDGPECRGYASGRMALLRSLSRSCAGVTATSTGGCRLNEHEVNHGIDVAKLVRELMRLDTTCGALV
jgi:hypothetical protein